MNAIEIRNLTKNFGEKQALCGFDMTVPKGAIYGFIGENGSGKSTTEKIICGLLNFNGGQVKLFGKDYTDTNVRANCGVLIESPGCYNNISVWNNLALHAYNLNIKNPEQEIKRVLKAVRMEGAASNKFKNCSLGMKQRIGIALALMGEPELLVLDEPINGLDADGMRVMREILTDLSKKGCTVLISSHILGELEKIATHYGIIRGGKMIKEISAKEMEERARVFISIKTENLAQTENLLRQKYPTVKSNNGYVLVYDIEDTERVVEYLLKNGQEIIEVKKNKIGLEEYYIELMSEKEIN